MKGSVINRPYTNFAILIQYSSFERVFRPDQNGTNRLFLRGLITEIFAIKLPEVLPEIVVCPAPGHMRSHLFPVNFRVTINFIVEIESESSKTRIDTGKKRGDVRRRL